MWYRFALLLAAGHLDYRTMRTETIADGTIPSFSDQIGHARRRLGLSQRQLGAQIRTPRRPNGVWNTYVGQIEKGEKVPSDEVVLKLAEVLQLDGGEVLLAAYRARTESAEVQTLFAQVESALHQQIMHSRDLGGRNPADGTAVFWTDEAWVERLADVLDSRGTAELGRLLSAVVGMNERQWGATVQALETISVAGPSR